MSPNRFPEGFLWGTAISSFQVEMGRGEPSTYTDWYTWVYDEDNIAAGRVSGDRPEEGPGFWELYPLDFRLAKEGLANNAIRLSIDWGRIFPRSTMGIEVDVDKDEWGNVSEVNIGEEAMNALGEAADGEAVQRYMEILREARDLDLSVMLTLYHWPIPLWLHDPIESRNKAGKAMGRGWLDQAAIVEFAKYTAYVAKTLGYLADFYATINEPRIVSEHGYLSEAGEFPPGLYEPELFMTAMKNLSIAHGVAYEQVKKWDQIKMSEFGPATVGIVSVLQYYEADDPEYDNDVEAAEFVEYLYNEWNLNAVFRGEYDMNLDRVIQPGEKLPHMVKGCDFIGVNYYSKWRVRHTEKGGDPHFNFSFTPCSGDCSDSGWETYPEGMRYVLGWAYTRYKSPIYVTENGIADAGDLKRERYLVDHLRQVHAAIEEDGVPVKGYFHWTLMDNFEWADGYKTQFGLYKVDRKTKERRPTRSASMYRYMASKNSLP